MSPRAVLAGLAGLLAVVLVAAPVLAADSDAEFKDWWVACDNVRVCTAYGFPPDDGVGAILRLRREAEAAAATVLDIHIAAEESKGVDGPLALSIDGKPMVRTGPPQGADDDYRVWAVPEAAAPALLAAIVRGDKVELKAGERLVATISLAGASAALRWIDDRQKRAGGITALVAKGPATMVPAAPPLPVIRAARPVSQAGLTDTPPAGVRARLEGLDCQAAPPEDPTSSRLAPGVVLWVIPCWVGAYQITSALVLADERGGHARLADLGGPGPPDGRAMATNAAFDSDTQRLSSYAKGRGLADCGVGFVYAWTGKGFALTDRSELSPCRGLPEQFWVDTFRSR